MPKFPVLLVLALMVCVPRLWGEMAPPEPAAVPIRFDEIFGPIGPRGLEYSVKARSLAGHRVSLRGYMVARESAPAGTFLLAPFPVQLHESEYGLADDLPAATVFVEAPGWWGRPVPHRPGPLTVTGTLGLGNREEPDGRISSVRLVLDGPLSDTVESSTEFKTKEGMP